MCLAYYLLSEEVSGIFAHAGEYLKFDSCQGVARGIAAKKPGENTMAAAAGSGSQGKLLRVLGFGVATSQCQAVS